MKEDLALFLRPGQMVQSTDDAVVGFTRRAIGIETQAKEQVIRLYYAVRDQIRYDPYDIEISAEGLSARRNLETGIGWCISKAVLLAACCRSIGVPARLGYSDVRNHLSTQKLREKMGTDVFYWHGYTAIYLNGKWLKATPAFNLELCHKFQIRPLDFDGEKDSIYHPLDLEGRRHMEYLRNRGEYHEPPVDQILSTYQKEYPAWQIAADGISGDFNTNVDIETLNSYR